MPKGKARGGQVAIVKVAPVGKKKKGKSGSVLRIKGQGGYGETIGAKLGGWVGNLAQNFLSKITGLGDYSVKANSIVNMSQGPPAFMQAGGCVTIAHREFIMEVQSVGSAFNIEGFNLNPTNPNLFPWLSEIAYSFETFKFKGMVFEFKSTYGDAIASTNASLGSVILSTQYNPTAPPFSDQQQMENYQYSTSCKPSVSMIHPVECDPSQLPMEHLYVFNLGGTSPNDPRWSNLATTYVATVGQQAAASVGELWVSYEIELYQPKLLSSVPSNGLTSHYGFSQSLTTITSTNWASTTPTQLGGDLLLTFSGGSTIVFPPGLSGTYLISVSATALSGTSVAAPTFNASADFTFAAPVNLWPSPSVTAPGFDTVGSFAAVSATNSGTGWQSIAEIAVVLSPTTPTAIPTVTFFPFTNPAQQAGFVGIDLKVIAISFNT
jgi:hypothetical protein